MVEAHRVSSSLGLPWCALLARLASPATIASFRYPFSRGLEGFKMCKKAIYRFLYANPLH